MSPTKTKTRIAIADDHACFREGLKLVLTRYSRGAIEVVAEAKNGEDLLRSVKRFAPEIVLTDVRMPGMDGIQACREISKNHPVVGVIAMSSFDEPALIYAMLEAGAKGYVSKTSSDAEMVEAIQTVQRGQTYYCNETSRTLVRLIAPGKHNGFRFNGGINLSQNEVAIVRLICHQLTTREIADKMHLCIKSVENYSKQIKEKIQAKNLVGIALFAVRNGYISAQEL